MNIRTVIVDDEVLSRRGIEIRLRDAARVRDRGAVRQRPRGVRRHPPAQAGPLFLDIQMPGMSGFEVLAQLPQESLPLVVFVTAYDQYAIQAFEARAVDYLLKPIDEARFDAALARVREHVRAHSAESQRDRLSRSLRRSPAPVSWRSMSCSRTAEGARAPRARSAADPPGPRDPARARRSIQWIDAAGDYMCIHAGGRPHILRGTMKELEELLDPKLFQRVHRSTIVNLRLVKSLRAHMNGEYFLTLEGGHELKLSRTYRDKVEYFLRAARRGARRARGTRRRAPEPLRPASESWHSASDV